MYFIPIENPMGVPVSLVIRLSIKLISDFTGLLEFRSAGDVGGLYYTVSMVIGIAVSFYSLDLYYEEMEARQALPADSGLPKEQVIGIIVTAFVLWLASFSSFILLIKPEYRRTFFTTKTGWANTCDHFLKENDEDKAIVLGCHKLQWISIKPDVVKWIDSNWFKWEDEQPEWFDADFKNRLEELDMIPQNAVEEYKIKKAKDERRASLGGGLSGGSGELGGSRNLVRRGR